MSCRYDDDSCVAHTESGARNPVYGGIVLNLNVGGINPAAVDVALKMGAVEVWMPPIHSLAHYQATGLMEDMVTRVQM